MRTKCGYCGDLCIRVTKEDALYVAHIGECIEEATEVSKKKYIQKQLDTLSDFEISNALKGHGAWDLDELKDTEKNRIRFIWLICWDIVDW